MGKKFAQNKISKKKTSAKTIVIAVIIAVTTIGAISAYLAQPSDNATKTNKDLLVGQWSDVHGVGAFTTGNDDSLYLATHQGLFKKNIDSGWIPVGSDRSDLMGFTIGSREGVMYTSGHPPSMGGNLGFRKSTDSGVTFQTISPVTDRPVDFHAMTASKADENIIYGSPGGGSILYMTADEGRTWNTISIPDRIISLAAHPSDRNIVFAGTVSGLFSSNNQGKDWHVIDAELIKGAVMGVGFVDENTVYAFVAPQQGKEYIVKSTDGGNTWAKTGQISGVKAMFNFAAGRSGQVYAIGYQQTTLGGVGMNVYKSSDGGASWTLEGTNNKSIVQ
jgi:photosystem II stability/assembly factor-like uncharacterized protein